METAMNDAIMEFPDKPDVELDVAYDDAGRIRGVRYTCRSRNKDDGRSAVDVLQILSWLLGVDFPDDVDETGRPTKEVK